MSFTLPSHPSWVLLRLGERALGDGSGCQLLSISKGPYHQQLERGGSFGPLQLHVSSNMELPKGHSNGENDVLNHAIYLSTLLSVGFLTSNAPKTYLLDALVRFSNFRSLWPLTICQIHQAGGLPTQRVKPGMSGESEMKPKTKGMKGTCLHTFTT
jgi:hypothetical protein